MSRLLSFPLPYPPRQETQAIHMTMGPGSYVEVTIPWITEETGYTTRVHGQLLHLDATTSMEYRSFIEAETLEVGASLASRFVSPFLIEKLAMFFSVFSRH